MSVSRVTPTQTHDLAILGAGSWGTAVAIHIAKAGHSVQLWGRDSDHIQHLISDRKNQKYLPDVLFPETLTPEIDLETCLHEAKEICIAVPSNGFHEVLSQFQKPPQHGITWLTKGMDPKTHLLLSQLVEEKWGKDVPCAIVSGPSFAKEVAKGLPTALTLASNHLSYQKRIAALLQHDHMRVYFSYDLIGVQLCGVVKNVLAIASGMSDGLDFGANTQAALITRGLAEMRRLGLAMGAEASTFQGLAGLGDLVLTSTDNQSRNRRFGLAIGKGTSPKEALESIHQVVEGYHNAQQALFLAQKHSIHMPICEAVEQVLNGKCSAHEAAIHLIESESMNPFES